MRQGHRRWNRTLPLSTGQKLHGAAGRSHPVTTDQYDETAPTSIDNARRWSLSSTRGRHQWPTRKSRPGPARTTEGDVQALVEIVAPVAPPRSRSRAVKPGQFARGAALWRWTAGVIVEYCQPDPWGGPTLGLNDRATVRGA